MMNLYLDIGGTNIRYQIDNSKIIKTKNRNFIELINSILKQNSIKNIHISFAGQIKGTTILSAPNINIKNLDLQKEFPNQKLYLENDLNCAVLAESDYFKEKDIIALYIGTGVGSGIISNGNLIKGFNNFAGEIGHIPFKKAPFKCGCGKDNCIELFSSGTAIKKWATHLNQNFTTLKELPNEVYNNFLEGILIATANLITLFNPKIVVLGGGIIKSNNFIVKYINEKISEYAFNPALKDIKILESELEEAPLLGSKLLR